MLQLAHYGLSKMNRNTKIGVAIGIILFLLFLGTVIFVTIFVGRGLN